MVIRGRNSEDFILEMSFNACYPIEVDVPIILAT
jgi:hypothetical protein